MKLETLHRRVFSLLPAIGPSTPPQVICRLLRKSFKYSPAVQIRCARPHAPGNINFLVWGTFHYTEDDRPKITVSVVAYETGKVTPVHETLFKIFEVLAHEYVHLSQHKKANGCPRIYKEKDPIKQYYGCSKEIDAFALSSALEETYMGIDTTREHYRRLFYLTDSRYKKFLKKRWRHIQTLPRTIHINRDHATIQTTQQR